MNSATTAFSLDEQRDIERVAELLRRSKNVLFITGAGMSADSGLPTYRGVGGLYEDDATEEGLPIEELLSGRMFRQDPELTWKYLRRVGDACRGATFNRGHQVMAEMERQLERVWTFTQNVDGFHRQAGSNNVIEIHGNLHNLRCTKCDWRETVENYGQVPALPRCPKCNGVVRPDVVLFGEYLPEEPVQQFYREWRKGFDMVFTIGTTSIFPYISDPIMRSRDRGIPTVEINPAQTEVSQLVGIKLKMGAAAALDAIWKRYEPEA